MRIPIKRFDTTYDLPAPDPRGGACFDLTTREDITIPAHEVGFVKLNVAVAIPAGHALLLFARSNIVHRKGVILANGVGVIDPYFCNDDDEMVAILLNITDKPVQITPGEQLIQGMFIRPEAYTWHEVKHMPTKGGGWVPPTREA